MFKLGLDGTFSILYDFCSLANCADGAYPYANLTLGSDGNFYGVTTGFPGQAPITYGSVYRLTASGTLTTLYTFCNEPGCVGGIFPYSALVEGPDGALYGTTTSNTTDSNGNPDNIGNVFRITTSGSLTVLHTFCSASAAGCADGYLPYSGVAVGSDGYLYGSTNGGGTGGRGTLYRISTSGSSFSVLSQYCSVSNTETDCADGTPPQWPLVLASDGKLYGLSSGGGAGSVQPGGVLFQVSSAGTRTPVYEFCSVSNCDDGSEPYGFSQAADGSFYGGTNGGGADGTGVVFRIAETPALPAPVTVSVSPSTIQPGESATLTWNVNANLLNNLSMEQCFGTTQTGGGNWSGVLTGTVSTDGYGGTATITPAAAGKYTYSVTCGGVMTAIATLLNGSQASTTTGLSLAGNPVQIGQAASATASVVASGTGPMPTGTVDFYLNGSYFAAVPVNGQGLATVSTVVPNATAGTYTLSADYSGDTANLASNSTTQTLTINKAQTIGTFSLNPKAPAIGYLQTLTVNLARTGSNSLPAGGTVTIYVNGEEITQQPVSNGTASLEVSTAGFPYGTYTLTCSYSGDNSDLASTCTPLPVTLKYPSSVSAVPTVNGTTISVATTVSGGGPTATGTITLTYGGNTLATFPLVNGAASYSQSLATLQNGSYAVGVNYSGDANHVPAAGSILIVCSNGCSAYQ